MLGQGVTADPRVLCSQTMIFIQNPCGFPANVQYPPASLFSDFRVFTGRDSLRLGFEVTGDIVMPEPVTWMLAAIGVALILALRHASEEVG